MKRMYGTFASDPEAEVNGIALDYTDFRITIARAGGANKKYAKALHRKSQPYQRLIALDQMDNDKAVDILMQVYAECVVKDWETKNDEDVWVTGIENPEGDELLPVNPANILKTFRALPDLFADVREQAEKGALFRTAIREQAEGN